jgi:hypothetical protein
LIAKEVTRVDSMASEKTPLLQKSAAKDDIAVKIGEIDTER